MNWSALSILVFGALIVAGLIALIILAVRTSSNRNSKGKFSVVGYVILALIGIPFAIGLLLPTMTHRRTVSENEVQITHPPSTAPIPAKMNDQHSPINRSTGEPNRQPGIVETYVPSPKDNEVRGTIPNMMLVGLSMIALLALARVAVDGRKDCGYGMPARLLAAGSFVALCAMLWALGPMV